MDYYEYKQFYDKYELILHVYYESSNEYFYKWNSIHWKY